MDYNGGTHISQIMADDKIVAMVYWIQNLDTSQIKGFSRSNEKRVIDTGFLEEEATQVTGMVNVWCFDLKTKKGFAIISIIKTSSGYFLLNIKTYSTKKGASFEAPYSFPVG